MIIISVEHSCTLPLKSCNTFIHQGRI